MSIDQLYTEIEQSQTVWKDLYDSLLKLSYDVDTPRPAINGDSLAIFQRRVGLVFELLNAIRPKSEEDISWSILGSRTTEIIAQLKNFNAHAQSSLNFLKQNWRDDLSIRDANNNFNWQLFEASTNIANQDAGGNFVHMQSSTNQLIGFVGQLLPLCKTPGVADLSSRAQAMGEVVRDIENLRKEADKLEKLVEQSAAAASEKEKSVQTIVVQAETAHSKIQALQQQATTDSANVTALVTQIKTTGASAQTLEQQITTYKAKFDVFEAELDKRLKQFSDFEINTKAAEKANSERAEEIDRLTKLADSMISGATTAGLSTSLEETRKRYEDRMNTANNGFYVAVVILILSALPLVAQLVPGLLGNWFPVPKSGESESPYAVLGKIILLLPATWLTAFFTKSYAEYFHLEREYAHKAALAKSVDGFKRQAQKYEEEITAEVFMEIRTNPANRDGPEPASHPLYDVLSKVVTKALGKGEKQ